MKITLCGSIAFFDEMLSRQKELESIGHEVKLPPHEIKDDNGDMIPVKQYYAIRKSTDKNDGWIWDAKEKAMRTHFEKVEWSDVVLILNYDKNNIINYIGANTLLEMGLAFHINKPIYLLNPIPEISYKEEILGMKPVVLNGDLSTLNKN